MSIDMTGYLTERYDEEQYFDEVITPLLEQVKVACEARDLPMFTAVGYGVGDGDHSIGVVLVRRGPERMPVNFVAMTAVAHDHELALEVAMRSAMKKKLQRDTH